jgi:hypothetical protein
MLSPILVLDPGMKLLSATKPLHVNALPNISVRSGHEAAVCYKTVSC